MSNAYFAFRQFGIRQDRCGMKVSTDACVFGAWIPVPETRAARMLDIGAGTGLLSLMLAQRHDTAQIDAIELDSAAAGQAAENCADSIFAARIAVHRKDARDYGSDAPVDLVVSNPPFFANSLKGPDAARNTARHTDTLDVADLFSIASRLLSASGSMALLLPTGATARVKAAAAASGFCCSSRLEIADRPGGAVKRICWLFTRTAGTQAIGRLNIRDGADYSAAFKELLRSYYLLL